MSRKASTAFKSIFDRGERKEKKVRIFVGKRKVFSLESHEAIFFFHRTIYCVWTDSTFSEAYFCPDICQILLDILRCPQLFAAQVTFYKYTVSLYILIKTSYHCKSLLPAVDCSQEPVSWLPPVRPALLAASRVCSPQGRKWSAPWDHATVVCCLSSTSP